MVNIYLGIYIIVAILVLAGGTYNLIKGKQTIGAILYFIGALTVLIVFGLKWFSPGSLFSETPVPWPTTINTCPDYLVYYGRTMPDGTTQQSCIDTIGVSKNGALKMFPKDGSPPSGNDYYFSLSTTSSDSASKNQELCQRAITMGLTWEGITNGESCITPSGPVAPSGGSGSGGGSGCPSQ
jgi:hypothetical protein